MLLDKNEVLPKSRIVPHIGYFEKVFLFCKRAYKREHMRNYRNINVNKPKAKRKLIYVNLLCSVCKNKDGNDLCKDCKVDYNRGRFKEFYKNQKIKQLSSKSKKSKQSTQSNQNGLTNSDIVVSEASDLLQECGDSAKDRVRRLPKYSNHMCDQCKNKESCDYCKDCKVLYPRVKGRFHYKKKKS